MRKVFILGDGQLVKGVFGNKKALWDCLVDEFERLPFTKRQIASLSHSETTYVKNGDHWVRLRILQTQYHSHKIKKA